MRSKKCLDCGEIKPETEFWKLQQSKDGLAYYCKPCFGQRNSRSYRKKQAEAGKTTRPYRRHSDVPEGMKYCARCKETKSVNEFGSNRATSLGRAHYCRPCHNEAMAEIRDRTHGSSRNYFLKLRYGVTEEQVAEMIAEQGGVCALCLRADAKHVDHSHLTGLVRRVLCFKCNGGLGQFHDDPDLLRLAADYLELRGSHARRMRIEIGAPVFGGPGRVRWDPEWRTRGEASRSARHYHLRRRYGINDEDSQWLLELQVGLCGVCFDFPAEHVDHDHVSGSVRGLACSGCNSGMGQMRDDPIVLRRAADYVTGRLVRTVPTEDGRTRLSLTVPDVDPVTVPRGGWKAIWEEDGQYRRLTLPFAEELDMPTWGGAGPEEVLPPV